MYYCQIDSVIKEIESRLECVNIWIILTHDYVMKIPQYLILNGDLYL